jgi:hypothetical protein
MHVSYHRPVLPNLTPPLPEPKTASKPGAIMNIAEFAEVYEVASTAEDLKQGGKRKSSAPRPPRQSCRERGNENGASDDLAKRHSGILAYPCFL